MRLIDADALLNEFTDERELWHWTGIRACIQAAPTVLPENQIESGSEKENFKGKTKKKDEKPQEHSDSEMETLSDRLKEYEAAEEE